MTEWYLTEITCGCTCIFFVIVDLTKTFFSATLNYNLQLITCNAMHIILFFHCEEDSPEWQGPGRERPGPDSERPGSDSERQRPVSERPGSDFERPGSDSYCWMAYSFIDSDVYQLLTVNYSIEFINKETGAHAQIWLVSNWNAVKKISTQIWNSKIFLWLFLGIEYWIIQKYLKNTDDKYYFFWPCKRVFSCIKEPICQRYNQINQLHYFRKR